MLEVVARPGGSFRVGEWLVEPSRNRMSKGDATVELEHSTMDVLLCLAERAGEPVPKDELAVRVWRTQSVPERTVSCRIAELKEALGDSGSDPGYIESMPERGFRLAAAVAVAERSATVTPFPDSRAGPERPVFVAREAELESLNGFLAQALVGEGRVAFVTGEAGTGKTALVQELVRRAQDAHSDLVAAVGVCSAQTGIGDAFAPWRQVLALVTGDVESGLGGGFTAADLGRRLWGAAPLAAEAVAESGRDLARHFERAGLVDRAVHYLHQAGTRATRMTANREAITHLERALELLATLPPSPERDARELELRMAIQQPLIALSGWADPRVGEEVEKAHRLAKKTGDPARLAQALFQLTWQEGSGCAAYIPRAIATGERLLALAEEHDEDNARLLAHLVLGLYTAIHADLGRARAHLEEVRSRYDPGRHHVLLFGGVDPGVGCRTHLVWVTHLMGHLDQALQYSAEGLELAERLGHSHSLAFAQRLAFWPHWFRHEYRAGAQILAAFRSTIDAHGFDHFKGLFEIYTGVLHLESGRPEHARELIARGLEKCERIGMRQGACHVPHCSIVLRCQSRRSAVRRGPQGRRKR